MGRRSIGQEGVESRQRRKKEGQQKWAGKQGQSRSKWYLPGFSINPGSVAMVLVTGDYKVDVVQTQVMHQGGARGEVWLGVKLVRGGVDLVGWVQSEVLQRRVAGDGAWQARLRSKCKEEWNVERLRWEGSEEAPIAGQGIRGAVVGWRGGTC